MSALESRVTALEAAVQGLEAAVRHLTDRLQQNSPTSSRPPSSDPPQAAVKRPRRESNGRWLDGQPGHGGHTRALVPLEAELLVGMPTGGFGPRVQAIAALPVPAG